MRLFLVFSQIKDMSNYLTVPAAPPDSPTMCRARLASGKRIHLRRRRFNSCNHLPPSGGEFTASPTGTHRRPLKPSVSLTQAVPAAALCPQLQPRDISHPVGNTRVHVPASMSTGVWFLF